MSLKGKCARCISRSCKRVFLVCSLVAIFISSINVSAQETTRGYILMNNTLMPFDVQLFPVFPVSRSAVAQDPYTAFVSWSASSHANGYRLEQFDEATTQWNIIYQGNRLSFTKKNLTVGEYLFRVRSCRDQACSAPSPVLSVSITAPVDSDHDGVFDYLDSCPFTSFTHDVDVNGCSVNQIDSDNDGVIDVLDLCPNSAAGSAVGVAGCVPTTVDDDGDGVTNDLDRCGFTSQSSTPDSEGCAPEQKDADNDGLFDFEDPYPLQHATQCTV